jgi:hypothetical protein
MYARLLSALPRGRTTTRTNTRQFPCVQVNLVFSFARPVENGLRWLAPNGHCHWPGFFARRICKQSNFGHIISSNAIKSHYSRPSGHPTDLPRLPRLSQVQSTPSSSHLSKGFKQVIRPMRSFLVPRVDSPKVNSYFNYSSVLLLSQVGYYSSCCLMLLLPTHN